MASAERDISHCSLYALPSLFHFSSHELLKNVGHEMSPPPPHPILNVGFPLAKAIVAILLTVVLSPKMAVFTIDIETLELAVKRLV